MIVRDTLGSNRFRGRFPSPTSVKIALSSARLYHKLMSCPPGRYDQRVYWQCVTWIGTAIL